MENKTITPHQLFTFTALSTLGGSILVISSTIAAVAKQDAWLSALINMAFGLLMTWIYCFIGTRYEGLTLIGIINKIFGKLLGKIVSIGYLLMFFSLAYGIPWYIGSFGAHLMHETPVPIITMLFVAALIISVYYGIEAFARATEIFYIFVTALFVISMVLVLPNSNLRYITPVLENGFTPILKGAVLLSSLVSTQNISILMIYPVHVSDRKGGKKSFIKGFLWANTVVFVTTLISVLVLGSTVVAKSSFPTVLLAREINVGIVLTRLEYAISVMWTMSEFVIGILFFYVTITGISEFVGLKDHRKIAAPMGLVILLLSVTVNPGAVEQSNWIIIGYTPNIIVFGFIIPMVMLVVYLIKTWLKKKTNNSIL